MTLPGWNSITATEWWSSFYFWASIISLLLLGVTEVLSHSYSTRNSTLAYQQEQATKNDYADAVQKLEEASEPRHLLPDEKAEIIKFLRDNTTGKGSFTIKASASAPDARAYADEIATLFNGPAIGWSVSVDNALIMGPNVFNMWVTIHDKNSVPFSAIALHAALLAAKLPLQVAITVDPTGPGPNDVWLNIGPRQ